MTSWRSSRRACSPGARRPPVAATVARCCAGLHQHFFEGATDTLTITGDPLFCWVYLDPDHPPRTLMLQWHSAGSWEHRAYWGENLMTSGVNGTASRVRQGDLPTLGRWERLEVPLGRVGLAAGAVLDGMGFVLFDGQAAFGPAGSGAAQTAAHLVLKYPAGGRAALGRRALGAPDLQRSVGPIRADAGRAADAGSHAAGDDRARISMRPRTARTSTSSTV